MLLLLCRTIVPVIFVFSISLFQGPLYIVQCSSKCCFVLLLPCNQSCSCYLRILLFRLFFNLLYCIYVVVFFYIRAMLLLFCLFIKLPFLVMLLLGFFRSIRATVLYNTRITFGVFSSLYRDKRASLLILLFGVFFLFEGSLDLYFSFILFEGGGGVCFGGWGCCFFFCVCLVFFFGFFAVSIAISF